MDFKRITSGFIVGLALIVLLLIQNNIITGLMFTLIAIVAMHEYLGAISKVCKPIKWISYLSCALVLLPSFISSQQLTGSLIYAIPIILLILFAHVIATDMKTSFKDMAYTLLGICYVPTFIMFLTMIDKMQNGKILLGYLTLSL